MNVEKSAFLPLRIKLRISRPGMAISLGFLNLRMDQLCGDLSKIHLPFRMADLNSALGDLQSGSLSQRYLKFPVAYWLTKSKRDDEHKEPACTATANKQKHANVTQIPLFPPLSKGDEREILTTVCFKLCRSSELL